MISLEEFKNSLGDLAKDLTEEEILRVRDNQDQMAEIMFNMWLKEKNNKKAEPSE